LDRNGSNIGGVAANADLSTNGVSVTFVYVDATQGWIVTDSGNRSDLPAPEYIVASGGTSYLLMEILKYILLQVQELLQFVQLGNPLGSTTVDYLVVAGGGAGGSMLDNLDSGGGGGAGGFRYSNQLIQ
jgi:hypothetical protein